jgi:hypothetical protein
MDIAVTAMCAIGNGCVLIAREDGSIVQVEISSGSHLSTTSTSENKSASAPAQASSSGSSTSAAGTTKGSKGPAAELTDGCANGGAKDTIHSPSNPNSTTRTPAGSTGHPNSTPASPLSPPRLVLTLRPETALSVSQEEIGAVCLAPDNNHILCADDLGEVSVVSLTPLQRVRVLRRQHDNLLMAIVAPPRFPQDCVTAGMDGRLVRWRWTLGQAEDVVDVTALARADAEAESAAAAATLTAAPSADTARTQVLNPPLVHTTAASHSGRCLAVGLGDGRIAIVPRTSRAKELCPAVYLSGQHTYAVGAVSFAGWDGDGALLSAGVDRRLCLWQGKLRPGAEAEEGAGGSVSGTLSTASETGTVVEGKAEGKSTGQGRGKKKNKGQAKGKRKGKPQASAPSGAASLTLRPPGEEADERLKRLDGGIHGFDCVQTLTMPFKASAMACWGPWVVVAGPVPKLVVYCHTESQGAEDGRA